MDKLSPEIVREILQHLSSQSITPLRLVDLANFRLVQRSFAMLAEDFLFREIAVVPSRRNLQRLIEISRRPNLAWHVKKVTLQVCSNLVEDMVWPEFEGRLQLENINHWYAEKTPNARGMQIFQACIDEWYEFQTSLDYMKALTTAFAGLPRLQALAVMDDIPTYSHVKPRNKTYQYKTPKKCIENFWTADFSLAFSALINAAYLTNANIRSFQVDVLREPEHGIDDSVFESSELLRRAATVFRNCRVIELAINHQTESCAMTRAIQRNPLFDAFSSTTYLQELSVSLGPKSGRPVLFPLIFGQDHVWPHLKRIHFWGLDLYDYELLGFFRRHATTLTEVSMWEGKLHTGCWIDVITIMREILRLVSVSLGDLMDPDGTTYSMRYGFTMSEYVLNGAEVPERGRC